MSLILPALTRRYADNKDFTLETPEIKLSGLGYTCVIGRNGSGKSSFGETLAMSPTGVGEHSWRYLPQYLERFLFAENIIEQLTDLLGVSVDRPVLAKHLTDLGFIEPEALFDLPFLLMSGGERRRMALATVFYLQPKYLILDEPEIGITAKENMVLLTKLNNLQASTMRLILISHNAQFVQGASDLICLEQGRVGRVGTTKELLADSAFDLSEWGVRFQQGTDSRSY